MMNSVQFGAKAYFTKPHLTDEQRQEISRIQNKLGAKVSETSAYAWLCGDLDVVVLDDKGDKAANTALKNLLKTFNGFGVDFENSYKALKAQGKETTEPIKARDCFVYDPNTNISAETEAGHVQHLANWYGLESIS